MGVVRFDVAPALVVAMLLVLPANAAVIVDSQGFEPPLFSTTFLGTGQLEGQAPGAFNGTWLRTIGGESTATVQDDVVSAGTQAVRVDRAPNSDDHWGVPVDGYPSTGQNFISISWSMRVEQTAGPANTLGPFFAMEAYDNSGVGPGLFGSFGVDASTGELLYQEEGTAILTPPSGNPTVPFGTWHDYQIELNFVADQYSFFLDGVQLGSAGFVDQASIPGGLDEFTDAQIAAVAAAGDQASRALSGTAFYDDFRVDEFSMVDPPPLGDFDFDGQVNVVDYLILSTHLFANVSALTTQQSYQLGDFTADLRIDGNDFAGFRTAYDDANGLGAFAAMLASVPEPSSGLLAAVGCGALTWRRWRSKMEPSSRGRRAASKKREAV